MINHFQSVGWLKRWADHCFVEYVKTFKRIFTHRLRPRHLNRLPRLWHLHCNAYHRHGTKSGAFYAPSMPGRFKCFVNSNSTTTVLLNTAPGVARETTGLLAGGWASSDGFHRFEHAVRFRTGNSDWFHCPGRTTGRYRVISPVRGVPSVRWRRTSAATISDGKLVSTTGFDSWSLPAFSMAR